MVIAAVARKAVGTLGNVISFFLFLSPLPTFISIYKKGAVEDFSPNPYLVTILNCALWVYYGMVHPNSLLVITINGIGLVMEIIYVAFYLLYANTKQRKSVVFKKGLPLLVGLALLLLLFSLIPNSKSWRGPAIGIVCVFFNILMYIMPCDMLYTVYKTKSLEYMPLPLSVFGVLNGGCWLTYALLGFDLFILISNGTGLVFGLIQLSFFAYYWFKYPQPKTDNWFKLGYNWMKSKINNEIDEEKVGGGGKVELSSTINIKD
ncbi:hypothetical protein MKX03_029480 [Papaver bracteatum]|nr:hypothetical protein MKX03_029480 [Papaver bracteatum]